MRRNRRIFTLGFAAAACLALLAPAAAHAQLSPISTGNYREDAPMFSPSAVVLSRGGLSLGGDFVYVLIDEAEFVGEDVDADIHAIQATGNVAFGVTDRITVGANVPYGKFSAESGGEEEDQSGLLDIDIYALAQLLRTGDGRTTLSGLFDVVLPTMDEDFFGFATEVDRDPSYAVGAAVMHRASRASLHGSASYLMGGDATFETDIATFELEGNDAVRLTGAALFGLTEQLKADGEVLVLVPVDDDEADTQTTIAGGLRFLATPSVFFDGGVSVPVSDSVIEAALLLGLTWTR